MKWGAHEVDGRIAARAAVKIRAALRQSIDAKRVYELYLESQPAVTDNPAQDNARARAWAMLNIRPNNNPLLTALENLWAEAFILGEDSAQDAIRQARQAKKAAEGEIDWSKWQAGDRKSALLITPPNAFRRLLEKQGVVVKGLDKTGYDRVGTALARSIRLGLGATSAAKQINNAIGDPARALTIAITETNRAVSLGAIKTYKDAHLEKMEWAVSDPCPECAQNSGQVIDIGGTFRSGAQQPPAHPHCRCALLPVIPDYETNQAGVTDLAPNHPGIAEGGGSPAEIHHHGRGSWSEPLRGKEALQALENRQRALQEIRQGATYTDEQWKSFYGVDKRKWLEDNWKRATEGHATYIRGTTTVFVPDNVELKMPLRKYLDHIDTLQAADAIDGLEVWISQDKLKDWGKDVKVTVAAAMRGGRTARTPQLAINPALATDTPYRYDFGWKMLLDNRETPQYVYTMAHEWGHLTEYWEGNHTLLSAWQESMKVNDRKIRALVKKHPDFMSRYGKTDAAEAYAEAYAKWRLQVSVGGSADPLTIEFAERYGWK